MLEEGEVQTKRVVPPADSPGVRRAADTIEFWSLVAAASLAAFYLITSIYIASHRLLWFDEILTVDIARLPNMATMWQALANGVDGTPPGYHILARMFVELLGPSQVAARLPSTLAMVAGMLVTFDCARRLTDGLHGLVALAALTCSFVPYYGYEARPYAIYFMLASLSLWLWIFTRDNSKSSAILFGAVIFLAVTIHYYAVLLLVPYGLWELYHWKPWQLPSSKLSAGVLGALLPIVILWKLMMSYSHNFSAHFWAAPSVWKLQEVFADFFPNGLFLLALVILWIVLVILTKRSRESIVVQPMPAGEGVGWLFLCIPLAGFVLAELKTNALVSRYFISLLPGVAVAISCLLWRCFRNSLYIPLGIFLLLTAWGAATQVTTAQHLGVRDPRPHGSPILTRQYLDLEDLVRSEGRAYFVLSKSVVHLEVEHNSKHPEEWILLLPSDPTISRDLMELKLAQYYPFQFWNFSDLEKHASEAALIDPESDILDELRQAGFKLTIRLSDPVEVVYVQ